MALIQYGEATPMRSIMTAIGQTAKFSRKSMSGAGRPDTIADCGP